MPETTMTEKTEEDVSKSEKKVLLVPTFILLAVTAMIFIGSYFNNEKEQPVTTTRRIPSTTNPKIILNSEYIIQSDLPEGFSFVTVTAPNNARGFFVSYFKNERIYRLSTIKGLDINDLLENYSSAIQYMNKTDFNNLTYKIKIKLGHGGLSEFDYIWRHDEDFLVVISDVDDESSIELTSFLLGKFPPTEDCCSEYSL